MCIFEGCHKKSYFNYPGETKALYCGEHRLDNMEDVIHLRCIFNGCKKQPCYNFIYEKKPIYCRVHRIEKMENVITPRCLYLTCNVIASYNIEGEKRPIRCYEHKENNMINITGIKKICKFPNCKVRANFNYENEKKLLYCSTHKKENMVMITSKICKTPLCFTTVKSKYDGYCLFCFINLFPHKPVSRNYKTKEYSVVEHVKTNFPDLTWISDKTIQDGCSKRRPDLFLDLGYQIIILEIDENQHIDYDCSCENKRIMELSQDVNHRPIIFVRFNPDEYTIEDPHTNIITKVSSCWGVNQNGICTVKKSKKKEWAERLESLSRQIEYWADPTNRTDKTIEVVQLFYDR